MRGRPLIVVLVLGLSIPFSGSSQDAGTYEGASWETLQERPFPQWFRDAKLGIFIHWGVYSVPAYSGPEDYAEWFLRGILAGDSVRIRFMRENFGADFQYRDFAPRFKAELFHPESWAELFRRAGARYVVLVSKHHDGYALWPSQYAPGWNSAEVGPGRDLVGELSQAVRQAGLHMGLYYSLGEWTHPLYRWMSDPPSRVGPYVREHLVPQFKELVLGYRPSLIFSDGDWQNSAEEWRSRELVGWYFDAVGPEAVVNDRWGKGSDIGFQTPEYSAGLAMSQRPWAEVRGLGRSFGLNRNEKLDAYLTPQELIHAFVRAVAAGGGMILNVGPGADGRIPLLQQERLLQLGQWLEVNGEAIYGARTWLRSSDSREVRLDRIDPSIDFDWVRNGPGRPIREDQFSATWEGFLRPEFSEEYTLEVLADDRIQVWVAGDLVLDEGKAGSEEEEPLPLAQGATLPLVAGRSYPIRVEYQEEDVNARAHLFWSSVSQGREIIPPENLRTEDGPEGLAGLRATYRSRQEWVAYTRKDDALYAIVFQWPGDTLKLPIPAPEQNARVSLLGGPEALPWEAGEGEIRVDLSGVRIEDLPGPWAWTLKIQGYRDP